MEVVDIVGLLALIITIIYTGFGLPVQIHKNYKAKSTKGLSLSMMILLFLTFSTWVVYGIVKMPMDWYIIISNSIGAVSGMIIISQFWAYRSGALKNKS